MNIFVKMACSWEMFFEELNGTSSQPVVSFHNTTCMGPRFSSTTFTTKRTPPSFTMHHHVLREDTHSTSHKEDGHQACKVDDPYLVHALRAGRRQHLSLKKPSPPTPSSISASPAIQHCGLKSVQEFFLHVSACTFPATAKAANMVGYDDSSGKRKACVQTHINPQRLRSDVVDVYGPCASRVCQEMELHHITVPEWEIMKQCIAMALFTCGVTSMKGDNMGVGLLLNTFRHVPLCKLIIPPASKPPRYGAGLDRPMGKCSWVWDKHVNKILQSGLLPWRCHEWPIQISGDCADNGVEGKVMEQGESTIGVFYAVECVLTRPPFTPRHLHKRVRTDACTHLGTGVARLDAMFATCPRMWFVPCTGSWWPNLYEALEHHGFSSRSCKQMQDPAFAPFV